MQSIPNVAYDRPANFWQKHPPSTGPAGGAARRPRSAARARRNEHTLVRSITVDIDDATVGENAAVVPDVCAILNVERAAVPVS